MSSMHIYPPICFLYQVDWKYWMGQNQRTFWLAPVSASTTHHLSMSQRRGGSQLQAHCGSVPRRTLSGRGEELDVGRRLAQMHINCTCNRHRRERTETVDIYSVIMLVEHYFTLLTTLLS
jgi:hypothetical protein